MQVVETKSEGLSRAYAMTLPASALEAKMKSKAFPPDESERWSGGRRK